MLLYRESAWSSIVIYKYFVINYGWTIENNSNGGGRKRIRSKTRGPNMTKAFHLCKLKGRIKKDYWRWKKLQYNKEGNVNDTTFDFGHARYVYDSKAVGMLVAIDEYKSLDKWLLDLKSSFHMTFNRDFFAAYNEVDGRSVTIGNNEIESVHKKSVMGW